MIFTVANAVLSDKYRQRTPFILLGIAVGIIGFVGLLAIPHPQLPGLTYGMLFIATSGIYMSLVPTVCFVGKSSTLYFSSQLFTHLKISANNLAPSSKRAIGMAHLICMGNLGGIAGSNIFLAQQAPHYWTGYGFILGIDCVAFLACLMLRYRLKKINSERDKMTDEQIRRLYSGVDLTELGDCSPYFRYTL